jgi:hypothetical protein
MYTCTHFIFLLFFSLSENTLQTLLTSHFPTPTLTYYQDLIQLHVSAPIFFFSSSPGKTLHNSLSTSQQPHAQPPSSTPFLNNAYICVHLSMLASLLLSLILQTIALQSKFFFFSSHVRTASVNTSLPESSLKIL